mmetsp:Transcript_38394/g.87910  ORF Transcript_38394/g.87910 Transcript_38394/m.87910 type:complete len:331 (-) Transcript_38394:869-1861(-)
MQDHQLSPQIHWHSELLGLQVPVGLQQQRVSCLVVSSFLFPLGNHQRDAHCVQKVAQCVLELVLEVLILGHIVRVPANEVHKLVNQGGVARLGNQVDSSIQLTLPALEIQLQGRRILVADTIVLGSLSKHVLLLVVLRDLNVPFLVFRVTKHLFVHLHLVVLARHFESLIVLVCQEQKLNPSSNVALLLTVLGHQQGTRHGLGLTYDLESPLRLVEVIKQNPHHVIPISGGLVRLHGLAVRSAALLGLGVLLVQLWGGHLLHQRGRSLEIEILDVQRCRLLKQTGHLVELRGLSELLHALQTGSTVLAQPLISELLCDGHSPSQVPKLNS